ncbi:MULTISPECIES: vWA domain-containing protein [unclassified Agarivorans]|uniref:vWA domain-containing protein n=1 Tax=unclassified Agarivorans TaxID=2636026 RepID=UPI0026E3A466|nr:MULTISPECIES: VWA domain-containing protein [unclassified Agarivorans]MDO6684739.1 VWA domain-containing protein [Agarivorans sp. 3_MG-2023]MDO6715100.1 VWA domain-containing protein [Agarivorans sp. 2_MG-2023]
MQDISLLRPEWLLLSPLLLLLLFKKHRREQSAWSQLLSPNIAKYLVSSPKQHKHSQWPLAALFTLILLALSGPSIVSDNVPLYREGSARVLIMDMSYSMRARDVKPDRVELAKYKALDLLKQWRDGETALIAFAGDAFVLSPLSSDTNTLANLVPHLKPELMPAHGSALNLAIEQAAQLIKQAGYAKGDVIVIGDGINQQQMDLSLASLQDNNLRFSMLALGTEEGAPIPLEDGSMLKDQYGSIVIPKLQAEFFLPLCQSTGGICQLISADNSDIEKLASLRSRKADNEQQSAQQGQIRKDIGYFLLPLILLLLLNSVRRADLLIVCLTVTSFISIKPASAADIWKNQAQQAQQAFEQEQFKDAAELFTDPNWQASAHYKAGEYQQAQQLFAQDDSAEGWYNQGNALSQLEKYPEAISAYEQALQRNPELEAAAHNKSVIEQLLEQQQNQQQQSQQSSDDSEQQESNDQQEQQSEQGEGEQSPPESEEQQASEQESEQQAGEDEQQQAQAEEPSESQEDAEQQQAAQAGSPDDLNQDELQQWLENLPNDPSLLLRNKMYLEYQKRRRQASNQENW